MDANKVKSVQKKNLINRLNHCVEVCIKKEISRAKLC